jgi:amidase
MSPLGLGNDGFGSLRHPAQCCGISVLKPTLGRIPDATTTGPADAPIGVRRQRAGLPAVRFRWASGAGCRRPSPALSTS